MVNIMGGFGHQFVSELNMGITNPLPILFITGTHYSYKPSCEYAYYFLKIADTMSKWKYYKMSIIRILLQ